MVDSLFNFRMDNLLENIDGEKLDFSFHKDERLCSKKIIDKLFAEGKSVFAFPLKIVYLEIAHSGKYPIQAAFTVGKRNFKRAVHRNLIKRRIREAYRLNKLKVYSEIGDKQVAVFFIFTGKAIPEYRQIELAVKKGMSKLILEMSANKS